MRTAWVDAGGVRLHVYEWGEPTAPPVLYWDGLGGTGLHANEIAPALARDCGLRVIAPDAPGHGRTPALPPERYRPSLLAELALDLLTALDSIPAGFLGFSWGAEIACGFAARFPERVSRVVLVDGGHWDWRDLPHVDTTKDVATCVAEARTRPPRRYPSWDAYFAAEREDLRRWTPALEAAHRATMREEDGAIVPVLDRDCAGGVRFGNYAEPTAATYPLLRASHIPILLLMPAETEAVAEAGAERFAREVPQLRVRRLAGDVHDLVSQAPDEVARIAGEWVRSG